MDCKGFMGRMWARRLAVGLIGLTLIPGCSKDEPDVPISLKGRIEKVSRTTDSTGEVTVRYFNENQNKETVGSALVTPETRIERNGGPVAFKDLEAGMQVNGQVRSVKEGGERKFRAVLIQIETAQPSGGG